MGFNPKSQNRDEVRSGNCPVAGCNPTKGPIFYAAAGPCVAYLMTQRPRNRRKKERKSPPFPRQAWRESVKGAIPRSTQISMSP